MNKSLFTYTLLLALPHTTKDPLYQPLFWHKKTEGGSNNDNNDKPIVAVSLLFNKPLQKLTIALN